MARLTEDIPGYLIAFGLSLLLHAGVVALAVVQWPFVKPIRLDQPVVYQVDLVTLTPPAPGRPLPASGAAPAPPAEPQRSQPTPVAAPRPAPPAPPPAPQPRAEVKIPEQPKPTPVAVPRPAPPPAPQPRAEKKPPEQPRPTPAQVKPTTPTRQPERTPPPRAEPSRDQVLAKALDAARQDVARRSTDELEQALAALRQETAAPSGRADASPEGVSVGGLVEIYAQMVESRIKANWRFPHVGSRPDLVAVVEVQLDADGRILGSKVVRSSGRPDFDASTERAVEETGQLPAPPRADLRTLRITFNLQEL